MNMNHLLGIIALIFVVLSISYFVLKRMKIKFLKFHCYFALIGTVFAVIHSYSSLFVLEFTFGKAALLIFICLDISGLMMRYLKGINKKYLRYTHIALSIFFVIMLIFHIIYYTFLN